MSYLILRNILPHDIIKIVNLYKDDDEKHRKLVFDFGVLHYIGSVFPILHFFGLPWRDYVRRPRKAQQLLYELQDSDDEQW